MAVRTIPLNNSYNHINSLQLSLNTLSTGFNNLKIRVTIVSKRVFHVIIENTKKVGSSIKLTAHFIISKTLKLKTLHVAILAVIVLGTISQTSPLVYSSQLFDVLVFAPVVEELVFRGALLSSLKYCQKGINRIRNWNSNYVPSEADLKAQKIFRVRTTAVLFGLGHSYQGPVGLISATFEGLIYGYLKEKTNSIVVPMSAHFNYNALVSIRKRFVPNQLLLPLFAFYCYHELALYRYATTESSNLAMN